MVQTEAATTDEEVIINSIIIKYTAMADNTRQNDSLGQGPNKDRSSEESTGSENLRGNVGHQKNSGDLGGASTLDEKSSGMGRRDKGTGLATKDGLTGSDFDGQVTE